MQSSDNVLSPLSLQTKSRTFQKTSLTRLLLSLSRSEGFTEDKGNNVFVNLFAHVFVSHTLLPLDSQELNYNRRQNELRHFAQNWAFLRFINFKRRKYSFPPPSPPCNVVPLFQLPIENNKHPNFEWRGQGRGADSFVLRSYPICIQCLNNFVADCLNLKSGCTSFRKLIEFIRFFMLGCKTPVGFYLSCLTSTYLFQNNQNKAISLFSGHEMSCLTVP